MLSHSLAQENDKAPTHVVNTNAHYTGNLKIHCTKKKRKAVAKYVKTLTYTTLGTYGEQFTSFPLKKKKRKQTARVMLETWKLPNKKKKKSKDCCLCRTKD